jgi:hypothetical protein
VLTTRLITTSSIAITKNIVELPPRFALSFAASSSADVLVTVGMSAGVNISTTFFPTSGRDSCDPFDFQPDVETSISLKHDGKETALTLTVQAALKPTTAFFSTDTNQRVRSLALIDATNDGLNDVIVSTSNNVVLCVNKNVSSTVTSGLFECSSIFNGFSIGTVAVGHVNNDGFADAVVQTGTSFVVLLNPGTALQGDIWPNISLSSTTSAATTLFLADLDGSGSQQLWAQSGMHSYLKPINPPTTANAVLLPGSADAITSLGTSACHLNDDAVLDLLVLSEDETGVAVANAYVSSATGMSRNVGPFPPNLSALSAGAEYVWGNCNGDDRADVIVFAANISLFVGIFVQNNNGSFTHAAIDRAFGGVRGADWFDVNGDQLPDIVLSGDALVVLINNGNCVFKQLGAQAGPVISGSSTVLTTDYDGDGDKDVIVLNKADTELVLLRNVATQRERYVTIRPTLASGAIAWGARVTLTNTADGTPVGSEDLLPTSMRNGRSSSLLFTTANATRVNILVKYVTGETREVLGMPMRRLARTVSLAHPQRSFATSPPLFESTLQGSYSACINSSPFKFGTNALKFNWASTAQGSPSGDKARLTCQIDAPGKLVLPTVSGLTVVTNTTTSFTFEGTTSVLSLGVAGVNITITAAGSVLFNCSLSEDPLGLAFRNVTARIAKAETFIVTMPMCAPTPASPTTPPPSPVPTTLSPIPSTTPVPPTPTKPVPTTSLSATTTLSPTAITMMTTTTTSAESATTSSTSTMAIADDESLNAIGGIIGGVLGGLALIVIIVAVVVFYVRRRQATSASAKEPASIPLPETQAQSSDYGLISALPPQAQYDDVDDIRAGNKSSV